MGGTAIVNPVVNYLARFPGRVITADELIRHAVTDKTQEQIRKALSGAMRNKPAIASSVETVQPGNSWRWVGSSGITGTVHAQSRAADDEHEHEQQPDPVRQPPAAPAPRPGPVPATGDGETMLPGDILEVVGTTGRDEAVIRSSTGKLYTAKPL